MTNDDGESVGASGADQTDQSGSAQGGLAAQETEGELGVGGVEDERADPAAVVAHHPARTLEHKRGVVARQVVQPQRSDRYAFTNLAIGIVVAVGAIIGLLFTPLIWAFILITLGGILGAALIFTKLREKKWFRDALSVVIVGALFASGIYMGWKVKHSHSKTIQATVHKSPRVPQWKIALGSTVPWCVNSVKIIANGPMPFGYKILIFDATADPDGNPTSNYTFDGEAEPVGSTPYQWVHHNVHIGSQYRVNAQGHPILNKNGKPKSNAGLRAVIVATLLTNSDYNKLHAVQGRGVSALPAALSERSDVVTRTAVAIPCKRATV